MPADRNDTSRAAPGRPRTATLERACAAAAGRGGRCLSAECSRATARLRWGCARGHEWEAIFASVVLQKSWCPACAPRGRPPTASKERAGAAAAARGGACLSEACARATETLRWRCAEGHEWATTFASVVLQKSWCPDCATYGRPPAADIEKAIRAAEARNGVCLSESVARGADRLRWECAEGHEWETTYACVVSMGSWCPRCALGPGRKENVCADVVRVLFRDRDFGKTRALPWLRLGRRGIPLELDMFNAEVGLAVEYNGRQHTEHVPFFHADEAAFAAQQARDAAKAAAADENWVSLLVVPHTVLEGVRTVEGQREVLARYLWAAVADLGYPPGVHLDSLDDLLAAVKR